MPKKNLNRKTMKNLKNSEVETDNEDNIREDEDQTEPSLSNI